jgi:RNase adapter protein RapZ
VNVRRRAREVDVTVLTGLSGAGRSEAAKALEDLGWFVIDNLPPALIRKMLSLVFHQADHEIQRVALVIDVRGGTFFPEAAKELEKLRRDFCNYRLVFLEASDEQLERRFESSRRRHPLSDRLVTGIQMERDLMSHFRDGADLIIDTTEISVRELRARLGAYFDSDDESEGLKTTVISFGYKFGLPLDADLVFDMRFLPNPHWIDELKPLTGKHAKVRDYVMGHEQTFDVLARLKDLFAVLLPGYQGEGRHYLTVAIGCTGGRHRSVVLAEEICTFMNDKGFATKVIHRDVEREPIQ